jgi:hypothetical protein
MFNFRSDIVSKSQRRRARKAKSLTKSTLPLYPLEIIRPSSVKPTPPSSATDIMDPKEDRKSSKPSKASRDLLVKTATMDPVTAERGKLESDNPDDFETVIVMLI